MKFKASLYSAFLVSILFSSACSRDLAKAKSFNPGIDPLAAAEKLDNQFLDAFNRGDIDAFMACYWNSAELKAYPPARVMELKGYNAVKEFYTKDFASNKGARLQYLGNTNTIVGDAVVGHGTFRWTLTVPGRDPIVIDARHTVVKAVKDGKMVVIIDHASAPMMMDAPKR